MIRMLANFNICAYVALSLIIAFLFVQNQYLKSDVDSLAFQLDLYLEQVSLLEKESNFHAEKITIAHANADHELKKDIEESQKILNSIVPSNCDSAIKWGIEQASKI